MKSQAVGSTNPAWPWPIWMTVARFSTTLQGFADTARKSSAAGIQSGCLFGRSGEVLRANQDSRESFEELRLYIAAVTFPVCVSAGWDDKRRSSGSVAGEICDRFVREDKFRT